MKVELVVVGVVLVGLVVPVGVVLGALCEGPPLSHSPLHSFVSHLGWLWLHSSGEWW